MRCFHAGFDFVNGLELHALVAGLDARLDAGLSFPVMSRQTSFFSFQGFEVYSEIHASLNCRVSNAVE